MFFKKATERTIKVFQAIFPVKIAAIKVTSKREEKKKIAQGPEGFPRASSFKIRFTGSIFKMAPSWNWPERHSLQFQNTWSNVCCANLLKSKIGAYNVNQRRERLVGLCLLTACSPPFLLIGDCSQSNAYYLALSVTHILTVGKKVREERGPSCSKADQRWGWIVIWVSFSFIQKHSWALGKF